MGKMKIQVIDASGDTILLAEYDFLTVTRERDGSTTIRLSDQPNADIPTVVDEALAKKA